MKKTYAESNKEELEWAYAVTREKFLERVNKMFPIKTDDWNRYLDGIFELISNDEAPLYESKMNAYLEETVVKYLHPSDDYVSLTKIARKYDAANPSYLIQSWLRSRNTVEFLATWERKHNSNFNEDAFQRITVDAKTPQFTLTPKKWIDLTNAIGIISKQGKSGGTMAHPFIACDFEMWNDAEFRFEVVKFFTSSEMEIFDSDNAE
ncbi:MAG: KilA-N domain-containing protein [Subdoligranulum sp.]